MLEEALSFTNGRSNKEGRIIDHPIRKITNTYLPYRIGPLDLDDVNKKLFP